MGVWSLKIRPVQAHSYPLRRFPAPWPSTSAICSSDSATVRFFSFFRSFVSRKTDVVKHSRRTDVFPSASHRVTLPPSTNNKSQETVTRRRFSIPYFVAPDAEKIVSCLSSCVGDDEGNPAKFEPVSFADYAANISRYQYKREEATIGV